MKRVLKASRWNDILVNRRQLPEQEPEQLLAPKRPMPERVVATTVEGTRLMAFVR